jgi:hypothetical protein
MYVNAALKAIAKILGCSHRITEGRLGNCIARIYTEDSTRTFTNEEQHIVNSKLKRSFSGGVGNNESA